MPTDSATRLEAAAALGRQSIAGAELPALLAQAVETVARHLPADFASFIELLPDGRAVQRAGSGWKRDVAADSTVELGRRSLAGYVLRSQTPLAVADIRSDQRFSVPSLLAEHGVVSSLLAPLFGTTRPLGVLAAHSREPRMRSADDIAWLQIVAHILSTKIEWLELAASGDNTKLLRAEQMMAVGQVAAGVAHELRNPLTSIKGLVQVNVRDLAARGVPADDLEVIEHEIRRMERTLQTFLDFARPPVPNRQMCDLGEIIDRVAALAGGRARKQQVEIRVLQPGRAAVAPVDADQVQQLLLNLVLNALDAMPRGGRVEIDLRPPRDGFLEVYVRDTGSGIAPHILPKVFETFVSDKETGVGLGLPLSRRIAEDHGGNLTAYNLPEEGACFLLRLPTTWP